MEITSQNFVQHLPIVKKSIETADFIAFDTEFSGYTVGIEDKGHDYDTVEERYQKLKYVCSKFIAFQVGISTFKWDDTIKKYSVRPFSFYVFPRSQIKDHTMLFQSNAVSFLVGNNFDFNKLMSCGINFTPLSQIKNLKQQCVYKVTKSFPSERQFSSLSRSHQIELDQMMNKIEEFVFDPTSGSKLIFNIGSYSLKKALSKQVTKVYINTGIFTEFQRNLSETVIKKSKQFKQSNFMRGYAKATDSKTRIIDLGFCEEDSNMQEQENPQNNVQPEEFKEQCLSQLLPQLILSSKTSQLGLIDLENDPFDQLPIELRQIAEDLHVNEVGFSLVIKLLSEVKKPLIGHNMIYDLGFITHMFMEPLPATYDQWQKQVEANFPLIYDTKVLSCEFNGRDSFGKTELSYLYQKCLSDKKLSNSIAFMFDQSHNEMFLSYETSKQSHDAGYDSYMTGVVFSTLAKFIEIGQVIGAGIQGEKPKQKGVHYSTLQNRPVNFKSLENFESRVMMNVDTKQVFNFRQMRKDVAQTETDHYTRIQSNCLQIQITDQSRALNVTDVGEIFREFGDVTVVKQDQNVFWVDYEEYTGEHTLKSVLESVKKKHSGLMQVRLTNDAVRFKC